MPQLRCTLCAVLVLHILNTSGELPALCYLFPCALVDDTRLYSMDSNNALGLTIHPEPEVFNLVGNVDWDSVTIVSLQSISDRDRKYSSSIPFRLPNVGRWRSGGGRRLCQSLWPTRCAYVTHIDSLMTNTEQTLYRREEPATSNT